MRHALYRVAASAIDEWCREPGARCGRSIVVHALLDAAAISHGAATISRRRGGSRRTRKSDGEGAVVARRGRRLEQPRRRHCSSDSVTASANVRESVNRST